MDQEIFKLELRLQLYGKLISFNITNIRNSNIILEFPWLEATEPLIF